MFDSDGVDSFWFYSSILPVTDLIKTAPILKHLKLAINFRFHRRDHISEALEHFCPTLVRLLTECRATSTILCVSTHRNWDRSFYATFSETICSAPTGCAEVNQLAEHGVFIIGPMTA